MSTNPNDDRTPAGLTAAVVGASFAVTAAVVAFLAGPLIIKVVVVPAGVVAALMLILNSLRLVSLPANRRRQSARPRRGDCLRLLRTHGE